MFSSSFITKVSFLSKSKSRRRHVFSIHLKANMISASSAAASAPPTRPPLFPPSSPAAASSPTKRFVPAPGGGNKMPPFVPAAAASAQLPPAASQQQQQPSSAMMTMQPSSSNYAAMVPYVSDGTGGGLGATALPIGQDGRPMYPPPNSTFPGVNAMYGQNQMTTMMMSPQQQQQQQQQMMMLNHMPGPQQQQLTRAHFFTEILSKFLQVVMMMAHSGHQVFSVVMGSYYAFHGMRAAMGYGGQDSAAVMSNMQNSQWDRQLWGPDPHGMARRAAGSPTAANAAAAASSSSSAAAAVTTTTKATSGGGLSRAILYFTLFAAAAHLVEYLFHKYQDSGEKDNEKEKEKGKEEMERARNYTIVRDPKYVAQENQRQQQQQQVGTDRRVVALVDYRGDENRPSNCLTFRAGDQFIVQSTDSSGWCFCVETVKQQAADQRPSAVAAAVGSEQQEELQQQQQGNVASGWISSKYLRPLVEMTRKL